MALADLIVHDDGRLFSNGRPCLSMYRIRPPGALLVHGEGLASAGSRCPARRLRRRWASCRPRHPCARSPSPSMARVATRRLPGYTSQSMSVRRGLLLAGSLWELVRFFVVLLLLASLLQATSGAGPWVFPWLLIVGSG